MLIARALACIGAISLLGAPVAVALPTLTAGVTPVSLSNFAPGSTATGAATLTATDTSTSGILQVQDLGSGAGKMVAATTGCAGSDATLANPLNVTVTPSAGTSSGQIAISASNQTVATPTFASLGAVVSLTASFSQTIPTTEAMRAGCMYSETVTFTLQ